MLTFQKVLEVFAQYLMQDSVVEVVRTRRGYTVLMWDQKQKNWWKNECCATPDQLLEVLLEAYELYLEETHCAGKRDLTSEEQEAICIETLRMKTLCKMK